MSGESWVGLEKLHQLTSDGNYSLHITMTDFDDKAYVAVYDEFEVREGDKKMVKLDQVYCA